MFFSVWAAPQKIAGIRLIQSCIINYFSTDYFSNRKVLELLLISLTATKFEGSRDKSVYFSDEILFM
jgi:hypothetical protein